ncbi:hypothetical protein ABGB12_06695 [Actinocorallia sp. B10E7]|uniref:hypothetical protein n=1 Tax=Actinocorallia sp. B10E7 TaxID=3153558 RepID=UPI00325CCA04
MPFLICARCSQRLTSDIQSASGPAQDIPGRPYLLAGTYTPSRDGGFVLNPGDVTGTTRHPDPTRSMGCCGPDGSNGPNLICRGCERETATEEADCWKPHFVVTIPGSTKLITDPSR